MNLAKKVCISALVCVVVVFESFGASGKGGKTPRKEATQQVRTEVVTRTQQTVVRRFSGLLDADQVAVLSFRVGGPLIERNTTPGASVRAGDVLMRIDPRDFQHDVDAADARLHVAEAQLAVMKIGARPEDIEILEAKIDSAKAQRDYALTEFRRAEPLLKRNAISASEVDLMRSNLRVANAHIASLEQELTKARTGERTEEVAVKEAEIVGLEVNLRISESRLADTYLRAPFDGVVARQNVNNFEIVHPGAPLITIMDISRLKVAIWVPEREFLRRTRTSATLKAVVTFPNLPGREFPATLKEAEVQADANTRAWKVTFSMENPEDVMLLPGMSAKVLIPVVKSGVEALLLVPIDSVRADAKGQNYVWLCGPDRHAVRRDVELGQLYDSEHVEIRSGLTDGERIVVAGAQFVESGMLLEEKHSHAP